MRTAYQYRLRPTSSQIATMSEWLDLLRRQYNYRLAERFNWWEDNRCDINACSIVHKASAPLVLQPDFYSQKRDLLNTKQLFSAYQDIHSQVLQNCIERVKKTFDIAPQPCGIAGSKAIAAGREAANLALRARADTAALPFHKSSKTAS